jgi:hypothetical protein
MAGKRDEWKKKVEVARAGIRRWGVLYEQRKGDVWNGKGRNRNRRREEKVTEKTERASLETMARNPIPDHDPRERDEADDKLEPHGAFAEEFANVGLLDGEVVKRGRFGAVEEEDEEGVEGVESGEEEMGGEVEGDEELEREKSAGGRRGQHRIEADGAFVGWFESGQEGEGENTNRKPQSPRLDVQKHKAERRHQPGPEHDQAQQQPEEHRRGREVAECFGSEEAGERVGDEGGVDIGFLGEEHVGHRGEGEAVGGEGVWVWMGELGGLGEGGYSEVRSLGGRMAYRYGKRIRLDNGL